jgi:hypothetical protein
MTFACVLGGDIGHQAVFYRIEMNVVDMRAVIAVIANCVFPEASLPDTPLGLDGSTG